MSYTKTTWVDNTTPINETNLNKIESGIKNNDINIGEENYDNTKTYEVGDIVRYNEKIYKCITAITTAENFDISKWEQTNIVEIVQSEKSKIYELIEALSTPIVGEGEYITLNDTAEKRFENFDIEGNSEQEATPSPDYPSEVKSCGDNGSINEVICNKNLVVEIQKGYWNNTGVFDFDNNFCSSKQIKVEPGKTYVCSLFDKNKKYVGKLVYTVFDKNKNFIRYSGEDTITIANNEKYVSLRTYTSQSSYVKNNNLLMQLEEGSTVTPYQECQSQIYTIPTQQPFRAIGDTRDTFIKKNNKWYERHPVIRKIFDESENWTWFNTGDSGLTGSTTASISLDNMISGNFLNGYCSHFVVGTSKLINTLRLGANNNMIYFYLKDTQFDNISIWTAWLKEQYEAGTPVYVDYVLEEPLDIECTEEQSTILFDIEQNAKTYKGVTHIYSNDAVSPNCYVEAVKDLTTLIQ